MKNKVIINFCPTGMVPTKRDNRHLPTSPHEIIEDTHAAYEIGITIVHIHARDPDEVPTWKPDVYRKIFEGIRIYCPDLIICGSSSGRNFHEIEKRTALLSLKPDMCSLTLGSQNFIHQASINSPNTILQLIQKMDEAGVHPELEVFNMGMINYGKYLMHKEILKPPFYWNLLFGNISGFQPTALQIGTALSEIPKGHFTALAGLGAHQLSVNAMGIALGTGVRFGLEDNIWLDKARSKPARNIDLVNRIHRLLDIHELTHMPPQEFGNQGFYNRYKWPQKSVS